MAGNAFPIPLALPGPTSGTKVSSRGAKMIPFTCRTGREFPGNLAGEQSRAPRQERTPK